MGYVLPSIYTPIHDEEMRLNVPVHEELKRKVIHNFNFIGSLVPIGQIILINVNQPGVPYPDPNYFQLCDGTQIVHPSSTLYGQYTPNWTERFIRLAVDPRDNSQGGNNIFSFKHKHGGATGTFNPDRRVGDEGDERLESRPHSHGIGDSLDENRVVNFPKGIYLSAFMKIN